MLNRKFALTAATLLLLGAGQALALDKNEKGTYLISTCQDLIDFATEANKVTGPTQCEGYDPDIEYRDGTCKKKNSSGVWEKVGVSVYASIQGFDAEVTAPIDMSECSAEFPMIGYQHARYAGTFNGNGYPISNLKIVSKAQNVGLFAVTDTSAVIKNVVLDSINYEGSGKQSLGTANPISIGGIVGWQYGGHIIQCNVTGQINTTGLEQRVGGITGYGASGTIEDSKSSVNIYTSSNASAIGGILGALSGTKVINTVYNGDEIINNGDGYTGGIAGRQNGDKSEDIDNCYYDKTKVDRPIGNGSSAGNSNAGATGVEDLNTTDVVDSLNKECTDNCVWSNGLDEISNMGVSSNKTNTTVYTIYFEAGEGCAFTQGATTFKELKKGDAITAVNISTPTCAEKTFLGWSLNSSATAPDEDLGTVSASTKVYAVWEPFVTVHFNANGGKFDADKAETVKKVAKGSAITAANIANPNDYDVGTGDAAKHYTFMGWSLSNKATEPGDLGKANGETTVYAVWKQTSDTYFTVTFNANGHGEAPSPIRVKKGDKVSAPSAISEAGYTFVGWYTTANATGAAYTFANNITSDVSLYAKWTAATYSIVYDLGEDAGASENTNPTSYTIETATITLTEPSLEGHIFMGWYTDEARTERIVKIAKGSTGDLNLYAKWELETYTVLYAEGTNGIGTTAPQKKVYGKPLTLYGSGIFQRDPYVQIGWAITDCGDSAYAFNGTYNENAPITLYPAWKDLERYNIIYTISNPLETSPDVTEYLDAKYINQTSAADIKHKAPTSLINEKYEIAGYESSDVGLTMDNPYFTMPNSEMSVTIKVTPKKETIIVKYDKGETDTIQVVVPVTNNNEQNIGAIIDALEKAATENSNVKVPQAGDKDAAGFEYDGKWEKNEKDEYVAVYDKVPEGSSVIEVVVGNDSKDTIKVVVKNDDTKDQIDDKINAAVDAAVAEAAGKGESIDAPSAGDKDAAGFEFDNNWEKNEDGKYEPSYDKVPEGSKVIEVITGKDESGKDEIVKVVVGNEDNSDKINDKINAAVDAAVEEAKNNGQSLDAPKPGDKDAAGFEFDGNWEKNEDGKYEPSYDNVPEGSKVVEVIAGKDNAGKDVIVEVVVGKNDKDDVVSDKIQNAVDAAVEEAKKEGETIETPKPGDKDAAGFEFDNNWEKNEDGKYEPSYDKVPDGSKVVEVVAGKDESGKDVVVEVVVGKKDKDDVVSDKIQNAVDAAVEEAKNNGETIVVPKPGDKDAAGFEFDNNWEKNEDGKYEPSYDKVPDGSKVVEVVAGKDESGKDVVVEVVVGKNDKDDVVSDKIQNAVEAAVEEAKKNGETIVVPKPGDKDAAGFEFDNNWEKNEDGKYEPSYDKVPDGSKVVEVVAGKDESGKDVIVEVVVGKNDKDDVVSDKIQNAVDAAVEEAKNNGETIETPKPGEKNETGFEFNGKWEKNEEGNYEPSYDKVPDDSKVVEVVVGKDTIEVVVGKDDDSEKVNEIISEAVAEVAKKDTSIKAPAIGDKDKNGNVYVGIWELDSEGNFVPVYSKNYKITYVMPKSAELSKQVTTYAAGKTTTLPTASIKDDASWKFQGWFKDVERSGSRITSISSSTTGNKTFYAKFEKTIKYEISGKTKSMQVVNVDSLTNDQAIKAALNKVKPEDKGDSTFSKWNLKDGVYHAVFTKATYVYASAAKPMLKAFVTGRTLNISGASKGLKMTVMNAKGKVVAQGTIELADMRVELPAAGTYMVRVGSAVRTMQVK